MKERTIEEINKKIENNEANIFTVREFKKLIKEDKTPSFEEVDVVTTGTCGVMSGTATIFNFIVSEPGKFMRAKNIYLNGVPANVGPCPNEWLGSVDLILHGTAKSLENPFYGGGFLLKDLLEAKDIEVKVETIEGEIIESETNINELIRGQLIGSRMAFKNYNSFTNPSDEDVSSIFGAIPLEGNFSTYTFSGCGDFNPIQNDPDLNIIKAGTKILLNGAEAYVLGEGTRSSQEKPNLMLSGNIKDMDSQYIGGFKTGEGGEVYDTVAIPIPVLNEEIYNNLLVVNEDIELGVMDIRGRHLPLSKTDYSKVWDAYDLRPKFIESDCINCDICRVEEICPTNAFNDKKLDLYRCFGCGICSHYCIGDSFNMNTGSLKLKIDDKVHNIPIVCRQSDLLRADKLSSHLKDLIENQEFKL